MINLLPPGCKKIVKREVVRRFFVVSGMFVSFFLIVQALFLLGLYFLINSSLLDFEHELEFTKKVAEKNNLEELEVKVEDVNGLLRLFSQARVQNRSVSSVIDEVLNILPKNMTLYSLRYNIESKNQEKLIKLSLNGHSLTRSELIGFVDQLKSVHMFKEVDLPVSNFLKEKDVDFSLNLILK